MLSDIGDISAIQADGAAPSVLAAGGAAGESGVQVVKLKYPGLGFAGYRAKPTSIIAQIAGSGTAEVRLNADCGL
jgi:hypothetical protein